MSVHEKKLDSRFLEGSWMSFTIAPSNQIQFTATEKNRWGKITDHVTKDVMNMLKAGGVTYIKLWPDLSFPKEIQPSSGIIPRIHWHGVILCDDVPRHLTYGYLQMNQYRVEIDTIENMSKWLKYCKKFTTKYDNYRMYKIEGGEDGYEIPADMG